MCCLPLTLAGSSRHKKMTSPNHTVLSSTQHLVHGFSQPSLLETPTFLFLILLHCHLQVKEARTAAEKAQQLLQNVANRKRNRQLEMGGLIVTHAVYGSHKALLRRHKSEEREDEVASQIIDVTLPLNFLINDSGQLKVCFLIEFLFYSSLPVSILCMCFVVVMFRNFFILAANMG